MCGVFGIWSHPEAANLTYLGLHGLQHRGQESAGIATSDGEQLYLHLGMGHVIDVFPPEHLARLVGSTAIGHVRYSTAGGSLLKNAQPIAVDCSQGSIAVAHNGNLTNAELLRERLEARGSIFQSVSDTEVIVHLFASSQQRSVVDRLADALAQVEGAYSLLCLTTKVMIAARDPRGIRPLCLGRMPGPPGSHVLASEPSSFDLIGAEYLREIAPGEMLVIDADGMRSIHPFGPAEGKKCIFEHVYFARPDSTLDGISVYEARKNLGRALAEEHPVDADVVIPVPDSGVPATIGYSERSGIPFEMGLVRSHYIGRTFIEPQQSIRNFGVRLKLNPVSGILKDKRVVVVDDSLVRGTTSRKIVRMIREAGAREVHLRISSPPIRWPCYYGIDTPTRDELIASSHSVQEIQDFITSDSLAYLSLERMTRAVLEAQRAVPNGPPRGRATNGGTDVEHAGSRSLPVLRPNAGHGEGGTEAGPGEDGFCHACWSGHYPVPFNAQPKQRQMRLLNL